MKQYLRKYFSFALLLTSFVAKSQSIGDIIVITGQVNPEETIGTFGKINELPKIEDTIKKISPINYSITSKAAETQYQPAQIFASKMKNEPLKKLYRSLLKAGYGNYNTPYAEFFINNLRSRDNAFGFRFKHLSSSWDLENRGFSGFSDNDVQLNAKHFFKKHTLSGEMNYFRNAVHFYGYNPKDFQTDYRDSTRQIFHLAEIKSNIVSHYTDTNKLNYDIHLNSYYLADRYKTNEFYIGSNALLSSQIKGEKLHVAVNADYYKFGSQTDTIGNGIIKLNPYFEASGKKWHANLGLMAALDQFSDSTAKFHFYPKLDIYYDVYKSILIPYAGISGDLKKNSFRSLTRINPFINSNPQLKNTSINMEFFAGFRGQFSSRINYDASISYQNVSDFALYNIDYSSLLQNRFSVHYADGNVLKVGGQVKYSNREKLNIGAQGYYFRYNMKDLSHAWHQPDFEIRLNGNYNLQSKIILKTDFYFIGNQWALQQFNNGSVWVTGPVKLKGIADINLGAEYRYSKFLSAFVQFNNLANVRYYRWDRYPTQRFNFMVGISFIPF